VTGNGGSVIRSLLTADYGADTVAILLLVKIVATCAAFGSGAVGGVFTPTLFVGAMTGWLFAWLAGTAWPGLGAAPLDFALVGMGAFLSAATRAPVMAIVMLFEMTLSYALMLPLIVGTVIAYGVARSFGADSLYGESLRAGPRSIFDRSLAEVTVSDIMRKSVNLLPTSASFGEIARQFLRNGASEMWVTDRDRQWRGAILLGDVEPFLRDPLLAETVIAGDILREDLTRLPPGLHLAEALTLFSKSPHERLPVIDDHGHFVGAVGRADLYLTISELTRRAGTTAAA
jgi:chloride channel protein, CIC family